jgi:hypothetical protein
MRKGYGGEFGCREAPDLLQMLEMGVGVMFLRFGDDFEQG